jgi:hypothetical protein
MKKNTVSTTDYLSPVDLEKQEHLSIDLLKTLSPKKDYRDDTSYVRPKENFLDLMNWTEQQFKKCLSLKDGEVIKKFVHNRIIIDGQFLRFAEENDIKVECLYQDSVISWKTEHGFEKFFMQGVFHIKTKDVEFLHSALFHKGNQFEDEISFFVLVSDKNYNNYVALRNSFDEWVGQRDRGNLHVRVIDGDDIPYTKDHTWDDLFLPNDIKTEIKNIVENFLASKDFYLENKIPWKRGILLFGEPGNGKTSIIRTIMSMYNFKPVTIVPGASDDAVRDAFSYAEEQSPSLLYFEDLDSLLEKIDISSFLNLMDGISTKNGLLVIATANEIKKLKANITDRPSRFDRKFEIPLPNQEMAYIYLKRWFGNLITAKKCREIAKLSEKYKFSYGYLKELYISSMFEALSNNRKVPTEKDVSKALECLMKDKNILKKGSTINTDRYFK